jgi:hypothetical protein
MSTRVIPTAICVSSRLIPYTKDVERLTGRMVKRGNDDLPMATNTMHDALFSKLSKSELTEIESMGYNDLSHTDKIKLGSAGDKISLYLSWTQYGWYVHFAWIEWKISDVVYR